MCIYADLYYVYVYILYYWSLVKDSHVSLKDWSKTKREGVHVKFYSYKKGGGQNKFKLAMLKGGGGHNTFWGSFYLLAWSFSHIVGGGGTTSFHPFKGWWGEGTKSFTLSWGRGGGAQKVSDPRFSHFIAPPPRN